MPFSSTSSPRIWLIASWRTASIRKPISFIDSMTVSASTATVQLQVELGGDADRHRSANITDNAPTTRLELG